MRSPLLVVLLLALVVRLVNLWQIAALPVAEYQFRWSESDMAFHYAWSSRILAGDVLSRDVPHPHTSWMEEIAPRETWERWRGGARAFFKAPLYPYSLALMRVLAGDGFWAIGLCQMALGLANVWLIFLLAERFFERSVATLAALGGGHSAY